MVTTTRTNPGIGTFQVAGKTLEIRQATTGDIRAILTLLNDEVLSSGIEKLTRVPGFVEYLGEPKFKDAPYEEKVREIVRHIREANLPDALVDSVDSVEVNKWIEAGLSFIAIIDGKIVGHMCGRDLGKEVKPELDGHIEITAGIVAPGYRDGRDVPLEARLNIQNRNRFALLNQLAIQYADAHDTKIVSISRQGKVVVPLMTSGFVEMPPETREKLRPVIWSEPWIARYATISTWNAVISERGVNAPDDYNRIIAEDQAKADAVGGLKR